MSDCLVARPPQRPGLGSLRAAWGFTVVELMFTLGTAAVLIVMAIARVDRGLAHYRALGAARHMAGRLQQARADAVARGANVALQFTPTGRGPILFTAFVDGNGNGVATADIQQGVDPPIGPPGGLTDFAGVDFGLEPGVPAADGTSIAGTDPIRFGASRLASFTPLGTSTSGSVYIRGSGGELFVVRVFGDTGKTRLLRFNRRAGQWEAP